MGRETDQKMPLVVHIDAQGMWPANAKNEGCTQDELKAAVKATGTVNVDN